MFNVLVLFFPLFSEAVLYCKLLNLSLITYCLKYIPGNISLSSDSDPVQLDQSAFTASQLGPNSQCPFFSNLYYQCNKYFIHCFNSSNPAVNATLEGMCDTVCWRSQSECNGYEIQPECNDGTFYYPPPSCYSIDYGQKSGESTWQYILGAVVGGIGLILACSLLYQWIRKLMWKPDPNAAIEFEDEKAKYEAEQRAGQRYQGLETARPFSSKDEFRTAQQARAEALHRQSLEQRSGTGGAAGHGDGVSIENDLETVPTELDDASQHAETKDSDIELT